MKEKMTKDWGEYWTEEYNRLVAIREWASSHPLTKKMEYENNAYDFKHRCERDIGTYVSQDDIASAYKALGYNVVRIDSPLYADKYCWEIKMG